MIDLIKKVKKENNMEIGDVVFGYCEWGEVHCFELKAVSSFGNEQCYELFIAEKYIKPDMFEITFKGTANDILITLEAIDNIYVIEEEEE